MTSNSKQLNSLSLSVDSVDSMRYKDEIPYDMTLPDEILQTESSFNPSDAIVTRPPCVTEEIVYNTNLPDEIFDTEESNISAISQTLSLRHSDAYQRRKIWISIVKSEIPKAQVQMIATRVSNFNMRKMIFGSFKQNH